MRDMIIDFSKLFTVDIKLCKECTKKLHDKINGKISQENLELWCAEKMCEFLKELEYEDIPNAPIKLRQFNAEKNVVGWRDLKLDEKRKMEKKVYSDEQVQQYMEKCDKLIAQDCSNAGKLEWAMDILKQHKKYDEVKKCWKVYSDYPDEISYIKGERIRWTKKRY